MKKQVSILIHDLTGVCDEQTYYLAYPHQILRQREIRGTRGYLDEEAQKELNAQIRAAVSGEAEGAVRIHFLDSGNYHYLSRLYLDLIDEAFTLIVYDHHTDMQGSAFGRILSCGSWIADAIESCPLLKGLVLVGADPGLIAECSYRDDPRVMFYDRLPEELPEGPIVLSIDKDVLAKEVFDSDWDQGTMTLEELTEDLKKLRERRRILYTDVCGEPLPGESAEIKKSSCINEGLILTLTGEKGDKTC